MGKNKKYKLLEDDYILVEKNGIPTTLHRIKALKNFGDVTKGDIGGYIESKRNLSYEDGDDSWVYDDARVYGLAIVRGDSSVRGMAVVKGTTVFADGSDASENSVVENAVFVDSKINGVSTAKEFCEVYNSSIRDSSNVVGRVNLRNSMISGHSQIVQSLAFPTLYIDGKIGCCDELITGNEYGTIYTTDDYYGAHKDKKKQEKKKSKIDPAVKDFVLFLAGFIVGTIVTVITFL